MKRAREALRTIAYRFRQCPMPVVAAHHCLGDRSLEQPRDVVVLVHGLLAGPRSMRPLAERLRRQQLDPLLWGYRSLRRSIAFHGHQLQRQLTQLGRDPLVARIHFVTHSMGGLVVRAALPKRLNKAGRLVMLAPPNRGSHWTRIPLGPLKWCCPILLELHESPDSFVNRMPSPAIEFGVIAAQRDRVVAVASTQHVDQADHLVLPGGHNQLLRSEDAAQSVLRFLRTGSFAPAAQRRPLRVAA